MTTIAQHVEAATAAFLEWQSGLSARDRAQLRVARTIEAAESISATHRLDAAIPAVFGGPGFEWRPAPILAPLGVRLGRIARDTGAFWSECAEHRSGTKVPVLQDARFRQCLSALDFDADKLLDRLDMACRLLGMYHRTHAVDRIGLCHAVLHVALWQQCREADADLRPVFGHGDPRSAWSDGYYCHA